MVRHVRPRVDSTIAGTVVPIPREHRGLTRARYRKEPQMNRRTFLGRSALLGGGLLVTTPFHGLMTRIARGAPSEATGYGPLVNKGELWLPAEFNYQVISRQGMPQSDGTPTPGIFDGMGAFPGEVGATVLVRNHENRERPGETKVAINPPAFEYDQATFGGNTRLRVRRRKAGSTASGIDLYEYEVIDSFNILGGTSTNCAGGQVPNKKWITGEEVVKRTAGAAGKKHGYIFEVDAMSEGPVPAVPVLAAGRFEHEATAWRAGIYYMTEDHGISPDPLTQKKLLGACFYRYIPDHRVGQNGNLAETTGVLQALKLRNEFHANMDVGREIGVPYRVEWVTVDEPDHDDDTNDRRDRAPGFKPTRVQAQDRGAAFFDRLEGMWVGPGHAKVYFDATTGGAPVKRGQVWEYDPGRETVTLIYQSRGAAELEFPDNVTIVPQTGDIFLCEDGDGEQYIRGVTLDGQIYDFAKTAANQTEFCGACFDPDHHTLYVNQQGERGSLPDGPPDQQAVTYAIYGPFQQRAGSNSKNFGNGPGR
jgi:secreted PhoX family phosphatase